MKKILSIVAVTAMIATSSFAEEANNFTFNKDNGSIGGIVGNTVVFIYKGKNDTAKIKDPLKLKILTQIAKKGVCESKETRSVIEALGANVLFIYANDNLDQATMVNIDNCNGIPSPTKQ